MKTLTFIIVMAVGGLPATSVITPSERVGLPPAHASSIFERLERIDGAPLATDAYCLRDCERRGFSGSYCMDVCQTAEDVSRPRHRADPRCMRECRAKGQAYGICEEQCTYRRGERALFGPTI